MKEITYKFLYIEKCNMCGTSIDSSNIIGKRLNCSQGFSPNKKIGISTSIEKCKKCSLIFSNPMPIPLDINSHYGIIPENYWKEEYFKIDTVYFSTVISKAKELIRDIKFIKSLDIGAGIGKAMISMENAGFDVYGIEPSIPFYQRAIERMKLSPDKLILSSIEDAIFPENHFDFITFGAVLEHLYSPSESIKKALYWTKPGGYIHVEVPSSNWLSNKIVNFFYKIRGLDYVANISPMHSPFHLYEFDLESFKLNSKILGYEIAHFEYFICDTFLPKPFDIILRPIMKLTNTGMQLSVWLKKI